MGTSRGLWAEGLTHLWPRDDTEGLPRFEPRSVAAIVFLLCSSALIFASIPLRGYLRAAWVPGFVVAGVVCLLLAGVTAWAGYLSGPRAVAVIAFADVAIVMAALSLVDRVGGQVVGALLVLPTLFIAIFMSWRWLAAQSVITVACAWTITGLADASPGIQFVRTLVLVTGAAAPAVVVLILRSQLDRAIGEAHHLATTDPLTGLLNRRGLDVVFPVLAARAAREGRPISVLVCDLDHFKRVNDELGHAAGDDVLRTIASVTASCVRNEDVVARLGGEELAIVTVADLDRVNLLAERVRGQVQRRSEAWGVTVSIGGVCLRQAASPAPEVGGQVLWSLVDAADDLMYRAKDAGRNRAYVEVIQAA